MSTITPWQASLRPVSNGEPVNASVTNRPIDRLGQRTQNLKDRLDQVEHATYLGLDDVPLESGALVGHAVYFNPTTLRYERALAALRVDNGQITAALSTFAAGIVATKTSATRGTILQFGFLPAPFDFTSAIGTVGNSAVDAGAYYLSASVPGQMTKLKPPAGIFMMYLRGDGSAHVQPSPRDLLGNHIHFDIELYAQPSGVVNCTNPGERYTFESTDISVPGWLPADHASFYGHAPAGAKFGYNIAAHDSLLQTWPPMPVGSCYLEVDGRGADRSVFIADENGLWWMDDCYGRGPWPTEQGCSSSSGSSDTCGVSTLEAEGYQYADPTVKRLRFYFAKLTAQTSVPIVNTLAPAEGSPITVENCAGQPATTGALKLGLQLATSVVTGQPGYNVLKSVNKTVFTAGPVVEKIRVGEGLAMSSSDSAGHGDVLLSLAGADFTTAGPIDLAALDGVLEENYNSILMLSFPSGRATSLRGKIDLGSLSAPANLLLEFWLLARVTGVLPPLTLTYRLLNAPGTGEELELPATEIALETLPVPAGAVTANNYVKALTTVPILVQPYAQVLFTFGRGASDSYAGAVSLLRMRYKTSPA